MSEKYFLNNLQQHSTEIGGQSSKVRNWWLRDNQRDPEESVQTAL